ncbi:hypothetical protein XI08_24195 [Bradyrhizobium sp. CCBAU 11361]|nr:hypothetical protein [Bradyrhizobium sp. CCBAU 11361]
MLKGAGGCARHEFPNPLQRWRLGALVALVAGVVAAWSTGGAAAQDGLQWTPVVWDAGRSTAEQQLRPTLFFPVQPRASTNLSHRAWRCSSRTAPARSLPSRSCTDVTQDSERRLFAFLERAMPKQLPRVSPSR